MDKLYLNLGFDKIAFSITNSSDKRQFILLGDYKQGKTSLLNYIATYILEHKPMLGQLVRLNLCLDPILGVEEYAPYVHYISNNEDLQSKRRQAYVHAVAGNFGKLSQTLVKLSKTHSQYTKIYNATEVTLLEDLENITDNCPAVFLCDDVDKWDWASIGLLKKMMLDKSTKWIRNSIFILSATPLNDTVNILDLENQRDIFDVFRLSNLPKDAVKEYALSVNSKIDIDELYEITKGNLGETGEFISYFNQVGNIAFFKNIQETLRNKISQQIQLQNEYNLEFNTNFMQQETKSTVNMINRSSIIGERFHRAILKELSQEEESFNRYLTYVLGSGIYGQSKTELFFTYSTVYNRLREYNHNQPQYHFLFAKALQKIMPSNFRLRAQELLLSKTDDWMAAVTYFNYIINYSKKYQSSSLIETDFIHLLTECGLYDCLLSLQSAYNCYYHGNFAQAVTLLPRKISQLEVDYQIDYLKCLILVNRNIIKSDYRDAATILLPWVDNKELRENEPYLWVQGAILYNEIMSEIDGETKYDSEIINTLQQYSVADLEFRVEYFDYFSKNNYTYTFDCQYDYTRQSVRFFEENTWIAGKALYARALANHIGNAIVMGEYSEAINLSNNFFKLLSEYTEIKNHLLVVASNYFVALTLSDSKNYSHSSAFAEFYESALPNVEDDCITTVLFKINYGLMLFLSNQDDKALAVYEELYNWVRSEDDVDDYYRFFIINNYKLIFGYINNELNNITFEELDGLNPCPNNPLYVNKHVQMLNVKTRDFQSKHDLLQPMGESKYGKAWSFWGRPLLFTDIQFWSD